MLPGCRAVDIHVSPCIAGHRRLGNQQLVKRSDVVEFRNIDLLIGVREIEVADQIAPDTARRGRIIAQDEAVATVAAPYVGNAGYRVIVVAFEIDRVVAGIAKYKVAARTTNEHVIAGAPIDRIVTRATVYCVATANRIDIGMLPHEQIVATIAVDRVSAHAAEYLVLATACHVQLWQAGRRGVLELRVCGIRPYVLPGEIESVGEIER